jgi:hypothetical protein
LDCWSKPKKKDKASLAQAEEEDPMLFLVSANIIQMGSPFSVSVLGAAMGDAALATVILPLLCVATKGSLGLGVMEDLREECVFS